MEPPVVVLVAGLGRSGSTLLEMMLASRLGAVAVGETRYLWERGFERGELCSCGAPVPECQFWTAILDETRSDDLPAPDAIAALQNYLNRNRRLPEMVVQPMRSRALREHLTNFARVSASLYRAIVEVSGRGIVVDSSKHPAYASALVDVPDVRVVVVHLVRDSRGVVHSWQRRARRPEVYWREEYMDQLATLPTALTWDVQNVSLELIRRRFRSHVRVRYEDFVADPHSTLDRIAEMCLDAGGSTTATPLVHSVAGNPMRFAGSAPDIKPDVAWRFEMSPARRTAVTLVTAPLLRWYGYSLWLPRGRTRSR